MNPADSLVLDPLVPIPLVGLLGLVLGALSVWTYWRVSARLGTGHRCFLLGLRLLLLAGLLLLLLQPSRVRVEARAADARVTLVAIDSSRSMRQTDVGGRSRFDAARALLWDAGLASRPGVSPPADLRLWRFDAEAAPLVGPIDNLAPEGADTRFHSAVQSMLGSLGAGEGADALFLLTDGHDFELVNAGRTAQAARARHVPIYAVPFGGELRARDLSVRIASYQPFHYIRQTIRVSATLRPLGISYETLEVALLREGREVARRTVVLRDEPQLPVVFEVTEPAAGQFEYTVRVTPLDGEAETANNSATTYLNVIDRKIRVLVLEGSPYWDTTFLQRSLRRNDKLEVDVASAYAQGRFHVVRTDAETEAFRLPGGADEWSAYDAVILGQAVDRVLKPAQLEALARWVDQLGGVVIFARGDAVSGTGALRGLQPLEWGELQRSEATVRVSAEGRGAPSLRLVAEANEAANTPPPLLGRRSAGEARPLSATLAVAAEADEFPAFVHRRFGAGQVLSVGVDGLWRWAFNARVEGGNTLFDRFWDQTLLWLVNSRDHTPGERYSFRAGTANVLLGERLHLRVVRRKAGDPALGPLVLTVHHGDKELERLSASPADGQGDRVLFEYLPTRTGPHRIETRLPDGGLRSVRFNVYEENAEATEVAADVAYLRRLAEASGGRVLAPEEFAEQLRAVKNAPVQSGDETRLEPAWPVAWVFWLLGLLGAADWFWRRRWGLA